MNKQKWLDLAEALDAFRVVPRILLILCYTLVILYIFWITSFFFGLETFSPEITAFVTVTVTALGGMLKSLTKNYFDSGRKWDDK